MPKQKQPQQPGEQSQGAGQTATNQAQQGGRGTQMQPDDHPDKNLKRQSDRQGAVGSQRGPTSNQIGSSNEDDEAPAMNDAGDQSADEHSSEKLRRGALDTQYGTDSSSKVGQQTRPQGTSGSSGAGSSETPTGSDRDTMGGARNKGR